MVWMRFWVIAIILLVGCDKHSANSPYSAEDKYSNTYYVSFNEPPKTLDPAQSYTVDETAIIAQIYEPPLQYAYLTRPYILIPLTATAMPTVQFYNEKKQLLKKVDLNSKVAYTVYTIHIKPGIYYQPHPAFARNKRGDYLYLQLTPSQANSINKLSDFPYQGTRELVAEDYAYGIKRLADPSVQSPIIGVMGSTIMGLDTLTNTIRKSRFNLKNTSFIDLRTLEIPGIKVIDRYTYQIVIKGQYPQFMYWLAMSFFAPIPWEVDKFYRQDNFIKKNLSLVWWPVGTGPYMLTENNPNRIMVLQKNPYFHPEYFPTVASKEDVAKGYLHSPGARLPLVDKVIFSLEKESIPRWNKFLQGYYDRSDISSDSFDQTVHIDGMGKATLTPSMQAKGIRLQTGVAPATFYFGFNMLDPAVGGSTDQARKLRQAISIALDIEEYINIFMNGRGIPAQSPIPPGVFGYQSGAKGINPYVYNWVNDRMQRKSINDAKQLMKEAGYNNGVDPKTGNPLKLNLDIPVTGDPQQRAILSWMQKQFRKLGIQLFIRDTLYNRFQEKVRLGDVQIFWLGWTADYPDPENFLFLLYGPNGKVKFDGENTTNYVNAQYDALFKEMKLLPNGPQRDQVIQQMLEIIRKDAVWVWGIHPLHFTLSHEWVHPYKTNEVAYNTLKYLKINPRLRVEMQHRWNIAIRWPIGLFLLLIFIICLPLLIQYHRRRQKPLLPPNSH